MFIWVTDPCKPSSYSFQIVSKLLKKIQVSYAATSTELSNTDKYDFLLRTVPSDNFQSAAMVDFIVDHLKWKSVFVIYSAGSYGEFGHESFIEAVNRREKKTNNSLCVVEKEKMKPGNQSTFLVN